MERDSTSRDLYQAVASAHGAPPGLPGVYNGASATDAFHMTVELGAVGVAHLDMSGRFLYANPALCQLTGYPREELLGLTFQEIIHPATAAEGVAQFPLLSGETGGASTCRLKPRADTPDGPALWARVTLITPTAAPGAPQYLIAYVEDISERKRLEDQLRAANQQLTQTAQDYQDQVSDLAATLDAMTDLVVVFDTAQRVRLVNRAARDFMGTFPTLDAARRALGMTDAQGRPVPPDQWVSSRVLRGETLTSAQAVDMLTSAVVGHETLFNVTGTPVRDAQGRIVGGVLVLRDMTERRQLERRAQEALQALLEMARTLVTPAPDAPQEEADGASGSPSAPALNPVAQRLAELTGRVLGCQRVSIVALEADGALMRVIALTGIEPEKQGAWLAGVNGHSMITFIGADRMRKLQSGETALLDLERQPLRSVARGRLAALAAPLRVGDQLMGALALGYDREPHAYTDDELALALALGQLVALVIERERLLQEREEARASVLALREANRRMDEFLGIAAHELRTPLTTLLGTVHLLQRRFARRPLDDRTREDLADQLRMVSRLLTTMDEQGLRLNRFISDLVDTSRIRIGQMEVHLQPCDLANIVHGAAEEQRLANPQRTIDLALPKDARASVMADADRLGQVIANYLTNALKYSREDTSVEARLSVEGDTARVAVRDSGPGLPPEEQPRVWDLFHRAPGIEVQSGSGIGLGMGLHICKTLIELHGGRVGVESAVGQGATFWFTLPLTTSEDAASRSPLR